jgi:hypothetical protein
MIYNRNPKNLTPTLTLTLGVPELPAFYGGVGGGFGQPPLLPRPPGQDAAEVLTMRGPLVQQGGTQSGFQVKERKGKERSMACGASFTRVRIDSR